MLNKKYSPVFGLITILLFLGACSSNPASIPSPSPVIDQGVSLQTETAPVFPSQPSTPPATPTASTTPAAIEIEIINDIPYTSQMKLDIYKPTGAGPWPVVVALHGGGQSKELFNLFSNRIANIGAVVFTPTWHSSEPQGDPLTREIIIKGDEDAACAVRFAREKAAEFGGDASRIVLVGYSGGGTAGGVMALAGDDFHGDCLVSTGSAFPDAFVGVDGAYDLVKCCVPEDLYVKAAPEDWELMVPYTYLDRQPINKERSFHLIVGETVELVEMAEYFHNQLKELGYRTTLTKFPTLDHGEIVSVPFAELFNVIQGALYP